MLNYNLLSLVELKIVKTLKIYKFKVYAPQKIRKRAINTNPIKYGDEKFYSSISLNTFRGVEKPKEKKEFLRIEKPTNIIKKKTVLEKRKEVTQTVCKNTK